MLLGMRKFAALLAVFVIGCGSDGGSNTGDDVPVDAPDNGTPDAAPLPPGYTKLVGRTWSLPAGATDTYRCVRFTVPADTYITNITAQAPSGTHHTVLSISASNVAGADGEYDCNVGTIGRPMLYASGVGTDPLDFPTNVGLKIAAGTQIHLNLHLFNATDNVLAGDSAILIKTTPTPPPMLAEMVFAGKILFTIPTGMHDVLDGGCTVNTPYTLFAYWPHMHKIAKHSKLELIRGTAPNPVITTVLHDQAYDFNEQTYYKPAAEVSVLQGDRIRVTCSYDNTTGQVVRFGDSTNDEMCFTGLYRYPSQNASITQCTDVPGGIPGG